MSNRLICFAGLDGAGKTELSRRLTDYISKFCDCEVVSIQRMGDISPDSTRKCIRFLKENKIHASYYETMAIRSAFEFKTRIDNIICELLDRGKFIICDRYVETFDLFMHLNDVRLDFSNRIIGEIPKPILHIYVDVPTDVCYERILKREKPLAADEHIDALIKAREFYLSNKDKYSFTVINANRPVEETFKDIRDIVDKSYLHDMFK